VGADGLRREKKERDKKRKREKSQGNGWKGDEVVLEVIMKVRWDNRMP